MQPCHGADRDRARAAARPRAPRAVWCRVQWGGPAQILAGTGRRPAQVTLRAGRRAATGLVGRQAEPGEAARRPARRRGQENAGVQFAIAGAGPDEARLRTQASTLDVTARARFLGFVPEADLPGLYRLADVFAIASEAELQSLATLEAMATGLPVAAVNAAHSANWSARGERVPCRSGRRRRDGSQAGPALRRPRDARRCPRRPRARRRPRRGPVPHGMGVLYRAARSGHGGRRAMTMSPRPPVPLLFLVGDNGGGHRSAANAVAQALDRLWPGCFAPVIDDPAGRPGRACACCAGSSASTGPSSGGAPGCGACCGVRTARLRRSAGSGGHSWPPPTPPSPRAVAASKPVMIVASSDDHRARRPGARRRGRTAARDHRDHRPDHGAPGVAEPRGRSCPSRRPRRWRTACRGRACRKSACLQIGVPVAAESAGLAAADAAAPRPAPLPRPARGRFLVVVTGGGEGSGGCTGAPPPSSSESRAVDVAVICGRNRLLRRGLLARLACANPGNAADRARLRRQHGRLASRR